MSRPDHQSGIIEIAAVISSRNLDLVATSHHFVKPIGTIPTFQTEQIHGISQSQLAFSPPWLAVRNSLRLLFRVFNVHTLVTNEQFPPVIGEQIDPDLACAHITLPTWQQRFESSFMHEHNIAWNFCRNADINLFCGDSKHSYFLPYTTGRQHARRYGYRCAMKDALLNFCAARHGVIMTINRPCSRLPLSLPTSIEPEIHLEGMKLNDPDVAKSIEKIIIVYLSMTHVPQTGLSARMHPESLAPVFAPFFDQEIPQIDKNSMLSQLFLKATQTFVWSNRHAIKDSCLLTAAEHLGSANFCELTPPNNSWLPPKTIVLISRTQIAINFPQTQTFTIPAKQTIVQSLSSCASIRKQIRAKHTLRVVLLNMFSSNQAQIIKRLAQQIRSLFCTTEIHIITSENKAIAARIRTITRKYHFTSHFIRQVTPFTDLPQLCPSAFNA